MRLSDVHPELRRAYWFMRMVPVGRPWLLTASRHVMSMAADPKPGADVRFEKVRFGHAGGARIFTPAGGGSGAAVLWIHGGGMVVGAASQDDRRCLEIARELDAVVVSAEYRLAPEDPFPAALDDCRDAWHWLQDHAVNRWIDPTRVAIGGQSAGGGLAASLVQRLHDERGVQPAAQWLFCPMLDDRTAANRDLDAVRHILWNNASNRVGWRSYLGVEPGAHTVPDDAVPARRADLAGLPPAWIGTGDIELFHDENVRYAEALRDAGVDCVLDVVAGAPHAFESLASRAGVSRAYLGRAFGWLRVRLSLGPDAGPFFHGTKAHLTPGSLLAPGWASNFGEQRTANFVYLTATMDAAVWGAELAVGQGSGRVYQVEPTGRFEDDPNLTNQRFPGNPTRSYRTRAPLRVVGEVKDWAPHPPEVLRQMLDHLDDLKAQGVEAIND